MEPLAGEDLLLGENFAAAIEDKKLTEHQIKHADAARRRLEMETPLWYYILAEAQKRHEGEHLGPMCGRIMAEVFLGILTGDSQSYLQVDPGWTPAREGLIPGGKLADLVVLEGDPTADISNSRKIHAVWHRGKKAAGPVETFTP